MRYIARVKAERVVVLMTAAEIDAIDRWAAPAGMTTRSMAIRQLIERGLRASNPGARNDDATEGMPRKQAHGGVDNSAPEGQSIHER